MKSEPYLTLVIKINSKQINDLDTKPEKKKLLGKNIGEKLLDIGLGNPFLDITTKANKETDKQTKMLLHIQRNKHQSEGTAYKMGENICKAYIW